MNPSEQINMSGTKHCLETESHSPIQFVVGGISYMISPANIDKFPDSFFATMLKPKWRQDANGQIVIERDGVIFEHVHDFLRFGTLPRNKYGRLLIDAPTKAALRIEADYYQLQKLVDECDENERNFSAVENYEIYKAVDESLNQCKEEDKSHWVIPRSVAQISDANRDEEEEEEEEESEEVMVKEQADNKNYNQFVELLKLVRAPFCVRGTIDIEIELNSDPIIIYKSSTFRALNLPELLEDATLSPFGKGFETVVDTDVRHSYEIDLKNTKLQWQFTSLVDVSPLYPNSRLEIHPYKLVIYKEGGHFEPHRDTVRGEGHIGTLVLILNSEYTGGELEVSHGDRTEVVTGAYSWVAMYGDCLHKINPVTSGTRVSLIFDICTKTPNSWEDNTVWSDCLYDAERFNDGHPLRFVDAAQKQALVEGMNQQMEGFEGVAICLQHLYPACQANPDFLKGGDQRLYDIFKDDFAVMVLPCIIYRRLICPYSDTERMSACTVKPYCDAKLAKEDAQLAAEAALVKAKFIIVDIMTDKHIASSEEIDYTGNESQGTETVYMVAALLVRRK